IGKKLEVADFMWCSYYYSFNYSAYFIGWKKISTFKVHTGTTGKIIVAILVKDRCPRGKERMRSIISMVSISLEGFMPSILLLVVIIVAVVIVAVILVVVVIDAIVGVVIVVASIGVVVVVMIIRIVIVDGGVSHIIKLSFVIIVTFPSMLWGSPPMKASIIFSVFGTMFGDKMANSWNLLTYAFAMAAACTSRAAATPSVISCRMVALVIAGVADVDVLLGAIYQHIHANTVQRKEFKTSRDKHGNNGMSDPIGVLDTKMALRYMIRIVMTYLIHNQFSWPISQVMVHNLDNVDNNIINQDPSPFCRPTKVEVRKELPKVSMNSCLASIRLYEPSPHWDTTWASPPDSELVSSEVMEIVIPKVGGIDDDILLPIDHDILREKLLDVNLLIAKIEALNANPTPSSDWKTKSSSTSLNSLLEETNTFDNSLPEIETFCFDVEEISSGTLNANPTPSSDCKTKSSSTSLNSLLEETNTFDNSLPEFETFCFDVEEISSGSTTISPDISLPEYEAFHDDHVKEISSGSLTTPSDISLSEYDSFIFDLSINPFPPADRSDSYKFTDELIPFISAPEYDCFCFTVEPNSRDFTKDVVENISLTKGPQVLTILPTHPSL
nr:hypothetical protein [Tanacetum cinerariifolium]